MGKKIDTIIIGGGQAGLAMSFHLKQLGREHVILERGRLAERWRSERWDSLMFQFPNWSIKLPGHVYKTDDTDGFAPNREIVQFIESYAMHFSCPVRTGVQVISARERPDSRRFAIETDQEIYEAANIVVATGPYQTPVIPPFSHSIPEGIFQVHTRDYRNSAQLPPGAVLVVGSGASGIQIAEELHEAGREIFLSVGQHQKTPRTYRGRDVYWWLGTLGILKQPFDQRARGRRFRPHVTGVGRGREIDLRRSAADGMTLLGRLQGVEGDKLHFARDLEQNLTEGEAAFAALISLMDDHARKSEMVLPQKPNLIEPPAERIESPSQLDIKDTKITSVLWASGYGYDFGWLKVPVLDNTGRPIHRRGITSCPGLYFLGLRDMYTMASSHLSGVGADAEFLAEHMSNSG